MKFHHQKLVFSLLFSTLSFFSNAAPDESKLVADFQRMLNWFPGTYDNKQQVSEEKAKSKDGKTTHELINHIFMPVNAPNMGEHVFFVKQYMDNDYENVYRQRLYVLQPDTKTHSIKLTIYSYLDEKKYRYVDKNPSIIAGIKAEELRSPPGCEVYWTLDEAGQSFTGKMIENACTFKSKRSGKTITISDTLKLTDKEIWINDKAVDQDGNWVFGNKDGVPHKNIKTQSLFAK